MWGESKFEVFSCQNVKILEKIARCARYGADQCARYGADQ